jgi:PAS domain S-box-containing protein
VLNKIDADFFSAREAKLNEEQDRHVIQTGEELVNVEGFIPGTRKGAWGLISKIPIMDSENKIAGVAGCFVDITKRRKAEQMRKLLEDIINSLPEAVGVFDITNKTYIFVNKTTEKLTGYPVEKFYSNGMEFLMENIVHPESRRDFLLKSDKVQEYNGKMISADGEIRNVRYKSYPSRSYFNREFKLVMAKEIPESTFEKKSYESKIKELLNMKNRVKEIEELLKNKETLSEVEKKIIKLCQP